MTMPSGPNAVPIVNAGENRSEDHRWQLDLALATELEALGPWGQRFPEPLFECRFEVIDQRVVGGSHLKMVLRSLDGGEPVDAIAFNCSPESLGGSSSVDLLYRVEVNRWRGSESCQLVVEHLVR